MIDNTLAEPCKAPKVVYSRYLYQMPLQERGKCLQSTYPQLLPEKVIKEQIKSKLNRRKEIIKIKAKINKTGEKQQ